MENDSLTPKPPAKVTIDGYKYVIVDREWWVSEAKRIQKLRGTFRAGGVATIILQLLGDRKLTV